MKYCLILLLFVMATPALAQFRNRGGDTSNLKKVTWKVGDDQREALIYLPPTTKGAPVVIAFHGHGGSSTFAARQFDFHKLWPEAICIYPQGLATATAVDPGGRLPGWQKSAGDENDRDLKFFDAIVKSLDTDYHADLKHLFIAGHSNGAFFSYLLWSTRGDNLAGIAPIAGLIGSAGTKNSKPLPVFHVAGEKDPLVKFEQQQATIDAVLKIDHCDPKGQPAGAHCTKYTSKEGPPVITFIHSGGHGIPDGATQQIADFFKSLASK